MQILTYNFDEAARFESFVDAAKVADTFIGSGDFFDNACIEFQCQGDHWTLKLSEGSFTPRWWAQA